MTGRNRQADLVRQIPHGHAAVRLQHGENLAVDRIEACHWDVLPVSVLILVIYTNIMPFDECLWERTSSHYG